MSVSRWPVLLLTAMIGIQPLATDLYLPALPGMREDLEATLAQAHLTLSAMLLGFGLSQLVWGPMADRWGRRPLLLMGCAGFALGGVGNMLSLSPEMLIVSRTLQGIAMGAVVMCGRAVVRDWYDPQGAARMMAKAMTGLGVIAMLCGPIGAWTVSVWGWRSTMSVHVIFGVLAWALIYWGFDESIRRRKPYAMRPRVLVGTWQRILAHRTFWAYGLLSICTYGGVFIFLSNSSFVFMRWLGLSAPAYGALIFSMSLTYIMSTLLCRRLLLRFGVKRTVAIGGMLSMASALSLVLSWLFVPASVFSVMAPVYLYVLGHGIHQPCGQSGLVAPFPNAAGAASSLGGFWMMVVAFAIGLVIGHFEDGSPTPMMLGVALWAALTAVVAWTLVQRLGPDHG